MTEKACVKTLIGRKRQSERTNISDSELVVIPKRNSSLEIRFSNVLVAGYSEDSDVSGYKQSDKTEEGEKNECI